MFNGWSCRGKMSYFSVNDEQKMTLITAKNATTEPLCGGKTGSQRQSVMIQQQITHCPASFLHFTTPPPPFFFSRYSAAPSQIPCRWPGHKANPAHPKHAATQYGGYKKDANTERLDVHGSVCVHQRTGLD